MAKTTTTSGSRVIPIGSPRPTMPPDDYFDLVDEVLRAAGRPGFGVDQRAIVEVRGTDGVLQILAGPGAGKTEVLVWRVLYELFVRGAEASRVMVTTFTRKAAQELAVRMVERSDALLAAAHARGPEIADPHVHDLRIGTLHSLCDQVMTELDDEHLKAGAQVIDDMETRLRFMRTMGFAYRHNGRKVLDETLRREEIACLFRPPWSDNEGNRLQKVDLALTLLNQHVETWVPRCGADRTANGIEVVHGAGGLTEDLILIRERWAEHLDQQHAMDYALLQERFMERQPNFVSAFDHVFVDEFQDTNPIQYAIHLGWVRHRGVRLTVVGDDDQALYRWRGSDIACFASLEGDCQTGGWAYRREVLEENNRSTANIVHFSQAFRDGTVLASDSLPKTIRPPDATVDGDPVRLLEADWQRLCARVAEEVEDAGAGRLPVPGADAAPTVAVLMASTSEVETRTGTRAALDLRRALEARGLRVYNPRNKSAGRPGSPVHDLLAIISYLIDPVVKAPAGKSDRKIEVWASCNDADKAAHALTTPPDFLMTTNHASIQKKLRKTYSNSIDDAGPDLGPVLDFVDQIRENLLGAREDDIRLTLGGLIPRLLAMPYFRSSGYTVELFRQALFTQMLDANIAVTRQTRKSLERPMVPRRGTDGRVVWPDQYWSLLSQFGQIIAAGGHDDLEVEAFAEAAVSVLTFHQAKGLEFDHVYVAMTGKEADPASALATALFSGDTPDYEVIGAHPVTKDADILRLAEADREREVYVAITRAKTRLTILHPPGDPRWAMKLNAGLDALFGGKAVKDGAVSIKEWTA